MLVLLVLLVLYIIYLETSASSGLNVMYTGGPNSRLNRERDVRPIAREHGYLRLGMHMNVRCGYNQHKIASLILFGIWKLQKPRRA